MKDWDKLVATWEATLGAVEYLGGATSLEAARAMGIQHTEVWGLHIEPPASPAEVALVEEAVGTALPAKLKDIFLMNARRVEFRWQLPDQLELPEELGEIFSGGFSLSLDRIPEIDHDKKGMAAVFNDPASEYDRVWQDKLAVMEGGFGDYYAFDRRDGICEEIIYLSHEDGPGHGYVLGLDFADFLRRFSAVGCPGPEDWDWFPFTPNRRSLIQPEGEAARLWRKKIGLELPD